MSKVEMILNNVRSMLQTNSIKLWLPPFYIEGIGPNEEEIDKLANALSADLNAPHAHVVAAISELQINAIEKLQARETFQQTGLATFKVRAPIKPRGTKTITVQHSLTDKGIDLQRSIAKELFLPVNRVKIISSGRVIQLDTSLAAQSITNNQQILAVIMDECVEVNKNESEMYDRVQKAREDALLLISSDDQHARLEDQQGNAVYLPPSERNALLMALALHEKGRALLKKNNYSEAIIFFLEADKEYDQCTASILKTVDNYALLNLDIVWCYFSLQSLQQLSDAERRLQVCEKSFEKSYGHDFSRVRELKGSTANECALVMRLHLLQAIVKYHQNDFHDAQKLLAKAESELRILKVDETTLEQIVAMGYTTTEARVALRATANNLGQAIDYIMDKKNKRLEARRKRRGEENELRLAGSRCRSGNDELWVNPRDLKVLCEMGFDNVLAAVALRKTANNLADAITELQENSEALRSEAAPDDGAVDAIVSMGFDREIVQMVLRHFLNNRDQAIEMLTMMQADGSLASLLSNPALNVDDGPSTSRGIARETPEEREERKMKLQEAMIRFSQDVAVDGDDYLDLPLEHEENILNEYKKLLRM